MKPSRILATAAVVGGLAFGVAGGEYGTLDWWSLRTTLTEEQEAIARLRVEIDTLEREARALESDPERQEREARRRFGMLRPGELLYQIREVP